ncbi:uncharacterized protein LOC143218009 isoform X2 [Lasioglossum baleicum]|uniref:uncharacterized protein LOC143218009 isoform X2 n=1 Tax=Lasioglossum baleicum TaxID=434251 RepID=UPI003FCC8CFC
MANLQFNYSNLPTSDEDAVVWAREHGLLRVSKNCNRHRRPMRLSNSPSYHRIGRFRCPSSRSNCRQYSGTVDSFFEHIRLPLYKAIRLIYCFTQNLSYADTADVLGGDCYTVLAPRTISAWFHYCREMTVNLLPKIQSGKPKLGGISASGEPTVVQIDEIQFGERKHKRGLNVGGYWLLGMVDVEKDDCRVAIVESLTADNLVDLIIENVEIGSEIHTNCFRSYAGLTEAGYIHTRVNRNFEFIACDGEHAQKIDSKWRPVKDWMRGRVRFHEDNFADRICEYLWRQHCHQNKIDPMASLIETIRIHYVFK